MLRNIPTVSEVIQAYRSLPDFGPRPMPGALQKVLDEANKTMKGGKRKGKVVPSEPA